MAWENRFVDDEGNDCLTSVDCTDCKVSKIGGADFRSFKTHKFKEPGLRYEIALCIKTGCIVWVMGPFPCGDWPDINIFRYALRQMLGPYERVEADDGYRGEDPLNVKVPASMVHDQRDVFLKMQSYVRRHDETVNKRIKQFKLLSSVFRGDIEFHGTCFRAVAALTQMEIDNGAKLFDVEYSDDYFEVLSAYG